MVFLQDLDTHAWVMSIFALTVCLFIICTDIYELRLKLPMRSRRARFVLLGLAFFCGGGVYETITNASDAPHISVSGMITPIRTVSLGHNRYWYLAHVDGSNGISKELNFDSDGLRIIKEHSRSAAYNVAYLDVPNDYYTNGKQFFWFKVVGISNAETGESYYYFDTRHHPVRAAFYLGDTLLLVLTSILVGRFADATPDTEDDYENYRDDPAGDRSVRSELTSLGLDPSRKEPS